MCRSVCWPNLLLEFSWHGANFRIFNPHSLKRREPKLHKHPIVGSTKIFTILGTFYTPHVQRLLGSRVGAAADMMESRERERKKELVNWALREDYYCRLIFSAATEVSFLQMQNIHTRHAGGQIVSIQYIPREVSRGPSATNRCLLTLNSEEGNANFSKWVFE